MLKLESRLRAVCAPALALGLVFAQERAAFACTCAEDPIGIPQEIPQNGILVFNDFLLQGLATQYRGDDSENRPLTEADLAVLTLVRYYGAHERLGLGGAGGEGPVPTDNSIAELVPVSATTLSFTHNSFGLYVIQPGQLLTPGEWTLAAQDHEFVVPLFEFEVTSSLDQSEPQTPVLESLKTIDEDVGESSCGDGHIRAVSAQFSKGEGFLLLDDTPDQRYADTALGGPIALVTSQSHLNFGTAACSFSYEPGTHLHFRVRRVTPSGKVSDWSKPVDATIPEDDGCGCSLPGAVSQRGWPAVCVVGLCGAVLLRRRARVASTRAM